MNSTQKKKYSRLPEEIKHLLQDHLDDFQLLDFKPFSFGYDLNFYLRKNKINIHNEYGFISITRNSQIVFDGTIEVLTQSNKEILNQKIS